MKKSYGYGIAIHDEDSIPLMHLPTTMTHSPHPPTTTVWSEEIGCWLFIHWPQSQSRWNSWHLIKAFHSQKEREHRTQLWDLTTRKKRWQSSAQVSLWRRRAWSSGHCFFFSSSSSQSKPLQVGWWWSCPAVEEEEVRGACWSMGWRWRWARRKAGGCCGLSLKRSTSAMRLSRGMWCLATSLVSLTTTAMSSQRPIPTTGAVKSSVAAGVTAHRREARPAAIQGVKLSL